MRPALVIGVAGRRTCPGEATVARQPVGARPFASAAIECDSCFGDRDTRRSETRSSEPTAVVRVERTLTIVAPAVREQLDIETARPLLATERWPHG